VANGTATADEIAAIFTAADAEIAAGIEFARNGTDPSPDEVTRDVYTPGIPA
jgi:TPP-dependent pyruvate/acetoin dehydrogenase alpha subunit